MHPAHQDGRFIVPRKDDAPDVGVVARTYTEPLGDEITELAAGHCTRFVERSTNLAELVTFGRALVDLIERRQAAGVDDFPDRTPVQPEQEQEQEAAPEEKPRRVLSDLTPAEKRRLVSAELGRLLDWICKGRRVLDMGLRVAAVASHIRRAAVDHRTDQELASEMGNDSRNSINKIKADLRRSLGADYPGENGKGTNTKKKCQTSRITKLQSSK